YEIKCKHAVSPHTQNKSSTISEDMNSGNQLILKPS
ncbi:unnamed protein product, partial [Rotaria sp. Silwood2]